VVTRTSTTLPAVPAGALQVILVRLLTTTSVAALVPNLTVASLVKLVPVMATVVPPAAGPALGVRSVTVGLPTAVYLKSSAGVLALVPAAVVTDTCTVVPTVPAGEVAVILVALTTVTLVAATVPNLTVASLVKLVP